MFYFGLQHLFTTIYVYRGCRDRMVVGFKTIYAISVQFESRSWQCVLDITLCDKVYQ